MKHIIYILSILTFILSSCEMHELPEASATEDDIFGTESGLRTYSYSFYNNITSGSDAYKGDAMSDYGAVNSLNNFLRKDAYSAETSSGWSWTALRNINHLIKENNNPKLAETVRNNYTGIARFFRAWFYYDMVVRFGDVPWVDQPIAVDEKELLFAKRDSRTLVMDKIMEDLDYAYEHIAAVNSDGTTITKWTALALKSRIALFEGTFRQYHTTLGLKNTASTFFNHTVDAATELMEKGPYRLNTGQGVEKSQRHLFISDAVQTNEVLFAVAFSKDLAVLNDANWWWTSATYGPRFSLVRPFINTILNIDGTPYTSRPDFETEMFYDEMQNRDHRLSQLIRTPGYTRNGVAAPPNFASYTYTGYQPIKYTLDDSYHDNGRSNTNAVPLIRYAEVLLNLAEAKAELGTLSQGDWTATIGALRARSGITSGINSLPTKVDNYLQKTFFPLINDPVLLEVRRERQVELALEGFRFNDLKRWNRGELMATLEWSGIYVPALNQLIDLDQNGTFDVVFYDGKESAPSIKVPAGVIQVPIAGKSTNFQTLTPTKHLEWFKAQSRNWYDDNRQIFYPIPATAIVKNDNLEQNMGWK
ncbi:RagB/SusD family nutrient uptake outer membrane protein [Sphingobacterium faecium]|uniref:RagB/SusD family nutrient uptake outer membrane protein n=1 Tax=Sphingobacterium faecium TaxID=34087 RepID=UPI002469256C|nr:RagB/SusD family nutrient uptake outer membrane protein [Sphingobacterium faecium]MDH5828782.1 RagB/SusD family nutrient uptake outer membrane protein [Sphingobacterium faecium]